MSRRDAGRGAAELARALGDPVRLEMLHRLMEGPAAVTELAAITGERQPNVSNHLAILRVRGLVIAARAGRQIIYRLRDASVAQLVEALLEVSHASLGAGPASPGSAISLARTCYDHLAGTVGVSVFQALLNRRALAISDRVRGEVKLGRGGRELFERLGIGVEAQPGSRRRFAYACMDWTERRPHLGGWLGAALCSRAFEAGWLVRKPGGRAVSITPSGKKTFKSFLGVSI